MEAFWKFWWKIHLAVSLQVVFTLSLVLVLVFLNPWFWYAFGLKKMVTPIEWYVIKIMIHYFKVNIELKNRGCMFLLIKMTYSSGATVVHGTWPPARFYSRYVFQQQQLSCYSSIAFPDPPSSLLQSALISIGWSKFAADRCLT